MISQKQSSLHQVFRTPFQSSPLDLGTDAFFAAREPLIHARLQEIRCTCFQNISLDDTKPSSPYGSC